MCGITGIFCWRDSIEPSWVKSMTDIIKHRGPDDEGYLSINTKKKPVLV